MADVVIRGTKDFQVPEYFNFADIIDEWAQKEKEGKRQSDHPALWWIDGVGNEVKWSYQDVALNSKKTGNVLSTIADIKPGDRVMAILPTIPEYWLIQAACLRTGGVLIITPDNIGPKELHRRILKSKPACVVAAPCDQIKSELLDVVDQITSSGQVDIRSRLLVSRMKHQQSREAWQSFEDHFQAASPDYQSVKSLSSAPVGIYFTSGTTGNAKMVEHSQASMGVGDAGIQLLRFVETDLIWSATPTGWSVLLLNTFCAWSVGAGLFAHYKKVTTREALETLQGYPITQGQFRPSIYIQALDEEDLKSFRFPTLNCCYVTGEPSNKQVIRKWKEETGVELWNCYGQTEPGFLTFSRDSGDILHFGSVGKALPGIDMFIVDDNDQEVPPGTLGRVVIRVKPYRPVGMFTRYVDDPEKTAACYSGNVYVTGDLGRRDADGYFWIDGRKDDIILCSALNINPCEVENCLKEHPAVLDCAVVSSPHLMGQTVKAFVVLSGGFKSRSQDEMVKELQDHVTYNTAAWMCPKKVEFIEDLPKTIVGKVNRRELRTREWSTE